MEITNINETDFEVTNGYDVITAEYAGEETEANGMRHPQWYLIVGDECCPMHAPKEEVLAYAVKLLTEPLGCAMDKREAEEMQEREGTIHGIVSVTLSELANTLPEAIADMVDSRLCEPMLCETRYAVVATSEDCQTLNSRGEGRLWEV